jgi:hypothetical protein
MGASGRDLNRDGNRECKSIQRPAEIVVLTAGRYSRSVTHIAAAS